MKTRRIKVLWVTYEVRDRDGNVLGSWPANKRGTWTEARAKSEARAWAKAERERDRERGVVVVRVRRVRRVAVPHA